MLKKIEYNGKLKARIRDCGCKQQDIAEKTRLDPSFISGFVLGYRIPTPKQAAALAECLDCDIKDIF